jgi:hypothetical protein
MISRRTIEEWISTISRILGVVGLIYELFINNLNNPTAIVVFGGLAGLPDALGYRQSIRQQEERKAEKAPKE